MQSNSVYLNFLKTEDMKDSSTVLDNVEIIEPVVIGKNNKIRNSRIGPNVSIGDNCDMADVNLDNSLIQDSCQLKSVTFSNSMIGNHVKVHGQPTSVSLGDYSEW